MTQRRFTRAERAKAVDLARIATLAGHTFEATVALVTARWGVPRRTAWRAAELGAAEARAVLRQRAPELVGAERLADLEAA